MCGVFGFIARKNHDLDLVQLKRIARVTESRGTHAFGFAWVDGSGRLKMFKQAGKISDYLGMLNLAADARMLIGHCRLATHGKPEQNINNHPHPVDGGWLVHNGVVHGYQRLLEVHNLFPVSDCDSEVLGQLFEESEGTMVERTRLAVNATDLSNLVTLSLWNRPRRLIAVRRGNPLWMSHDTTGTYLGSCTDDLPGELQKVRNDSILEFRDGGALKQYRLRRPVAGVVEEQVELPF